MPAVSVSPTTSTLIVAVDYDRTLVVISNADASANLHINFAAAATTNEAYISPGGNMTIGDSRCKVAINGISSSGTITAKYSKLSAGS
jgi:hypothetical protein